MYPILLTIVEKFYDTDINAILYQFEANVIQLLTFQITAVCKIIKATLSMK